MKHIRSIIENNEFKNNIDLLNDMQDIFTNLEDEYDEIKVYSYFMKYKGNDLFYVHGPDGKYLSNFKTNTKLNYDYWQIIFSGSNLEPPKCEEIYKSSILLINQVIGLTGLEIAHQSGISIVDYRNMKILTTNFIDNPSSEIEEVIKRSESITGLVTFRRSD